MLWITGFGKCNEKLIVPDRDPVTRDWTVANGGTA